jgi:hypothetical protein
MLLSSLLAALNIDRVAEEGRATFQWATPDDAAGASSSAAFEIGDGWVTFNVVERYDGEPHPAISGKVAVAGEAAPALIFSSDADRDALEQFREAVSVMQRV